LKEHFLFPINYHPESYTYKFQKENVEKSTESFYKAFSIDKNFVDARLALAVNLLILGYYDDYLEKYLNPDLSAKYLKAQLNNIVSYMSLVHRTMTLLPHTFTNCVWCVENMLKETKLPPNMYLGLADFYWQQGKLDDAKRVYKMGLKAYPDNSLLLEGLTLFQLALRELYDAEQTCKQLLSLRPFSIRVRLTLGSIYLNQRRHTESAQLFRELADNPFIKPPIARLRTFISKAGSTGTSALPTA